MVLFLFEELEPQIFDKNNLRKREATVADKDLQEIGCFTKISSLRNLNFL